MSGLFVLVLGWWMCSSNSLSISLVPSKIPLRFRAHADPGSLVSMPSSSGGADGLGRLVLCMFSVWLSGVVNVMSG